MLVVDSSVWIDLFHNRLTAQTERLRERGTRRRILVLDLVMLEVLQGARSEPNALEIEQQLRRFQLADARGPELAVAAARNFRMLRGLGFTVRKQIDLLIGSFCIVYGHELLHADRDFEPMQRHLGLRVAGGADPLH